MTKTKLVELLVAARALIETPAQWIQGTYAKNAEGFIVPSHSENATCFCSVGATKAVVSYDTADYSTLTSALRTALRTFGVDSGVVTYNDKPGRTHAEVLAIWDKAIEITKAEAVVEALILAKEKIAAPGAWTQGFYAKDAEGNQIRGNEKGAVCFCAYGAIEAATGSYHRSGDTWQDTAFDVLNDASMAVTGQYAANYNDVPGRTNAEVLAVFDAGIKLGREKVLVLRG